MAVAEIRIAVMHQPDSPEAAPNVVVARFRSAAEAALFMCHQAFSEHWFQTPGCMQIVSSDSQGLLSITDDGAKYTPPQWRNDVDQ